MQSGTKSVTLMPAYSILTHLSVPYIFSSCVCSYNRFKLVLAVKIFRT